jgi:hypothetical protein
MNDDEKRLPRVRFLAAVGSWGADRFLSDFSEKIEENQKEDLR